jgi:dTMP kinase
MLSFGSWSAKTMVGHGIFICLEGLDGCGKTTQAKLLVRRLKTKCEAFYTAEPSRGQIGKLIKKRYLHVSTRGSTVVEALLFAADRVEHLKNEVAPALEKGKIVVSDRYVFSSLAYQGATGIDLKWIENVNKHAFRPDLALFIDVDPKTVVRRLKQKKSVMENLETQLKVQQVYSKYVETGALVRIDGSKSKSEVAKAIWQIVNDHLRRTS